MKLFICSLLHPSVTSYILGRSNLLSRLRGITLQQLNVPTEIDAFKTQPFRSHDPTVTGESACYGTEKPTSDVYE